VTPGRKCRGGYSPIVWQIRQLRLGLAAWARNAIRWSATPYSIEKPSFNWRRTPHSTLPDPSHTEIAWCVPSSSNRDALLSASPSVGKISIRVEPGPRVSWGTLANP